MVKSYPYFLSGTDVGLRMITIYIFLVYLIWTSLAIAMSSLPDPSLDYSRNPKNITSIPPASTLAALYSPLNTLIQAHFREYGHDAIDTVLALFCVWSSVHGKTRQQRILAVVASIWTSFSWFIYARYTIQAFGYYNTGTLNPFCVSTWKSFPAQPALNINVPLSPNYCIVMRGTAVCSLLLLLGRILLTMYAIGQFYETKGEEPYCKADKEEIQRNAPKRQQLLDEQQKQPALAQPALADIVIQSQPHTTEHVTVPGKAVSGISSVAECSLTRASYVIMFFIWLTVAGFIITMLSFIELLRLDHQQPGILFKAIGNRLFDTVMVYPMLKLFFSVALGAFAAYERVRENLYNPLLINFLGTMSLWGLFIYGARRLTLTNCPDYANGENCMEYPASQRAMVAGWGIMSCSELLRMGAMVWKIRETPKTQVTNAMIAAKAAAVTAPSSRLGRWGYAFCNSLYLVIIFAYFLVILAEQSMTGLFQVQPTSGIPKVGFASPFGQSSVEDILEWPYHNFAISILSMGWMMGTNHYVDLGGTRSTAFAAFLTQVIHCGVWLALCFPPAYAMFTSSGYFHDVWCVNSFTSVYGNDPCNYITASGRLAILFFAVMVFNTCINGIRLLSIDIGTGRRARAAQPGQEVSPTGCVSSNSPWLLGEIGLWLTVFGWIIYCLAAANEGQKAYFVGDEIDSTFGFNLFQFISVHYFSVAILIGPGMTTAHLLTNREYRQHSYGWRLGQIVTFSLHTSFLIVMIVILARYVYNLDLNKSQLALFSGLVILLAGDVFSFMAFRAYFLARPVVRLVPGPMIGVASADPLLNKAHGEDEIAMVPVNTNTVSSAAAPESNSAHHHDSSHSNSDPQKGEFQFQAEPMEQVTSSTPHHQDHDQHHKHNNTNTHWHMDQDDE